MGWQGIVPAKAAKMAADSTDLMTAKLFNIAELFARIDPRRMAQEFAPGLRSMISGIIDEMAASYASVSAMMRANRPWRLR